MIILLKYYYYLNNIVLFKNTITASYTIITSYFAKNFVILY